MTSPEARAGGQEPSVAERVLHVAYGEVFDYQAHDVYEMTDDEVSGYFVTVAPRSSDEQMGPMDRAARSLATERYYVNDAGDIFRLPSWISGHDDIDFAFTVPNPNGRPILLGNIDGTVVRSAMDVPTSADASAAAAMNVSDQLNEGATLEDLRSTLRPESDGQ